MPANSSFNNQDPFTREMTPETAETQANPQEDPWSRVERRIQQKDVELQQSRERQIQTLEGMTQARDSRQELKNKILGAGVDSEITRSFSEGFMQGTGTIFDGVADTAELVGVDEESGFVQGSRSAGDWFEEGAEEIRDTRFRGDVHAQEQSTPTGDLFDPSTWSMGEDASAAGYASQLSNILGGFAPQAAALLATKPVAIAGGVGIGALQIGGGQGREAYEYIDRMDENTLFEDSELYQELRQSDTAMTHEEAKRQTAESARASAFMASAPVGAIGGGATNMLLRGVQDPLSRSAGGRLLNNTVLTGASEGSQEVMENVAGRAGTNLGAGTERDLTENTFGDFTLGAGFGASLGTGRSAVTEPVNALRESAEGTAEDHARQGRHDQDMLARLQEGDLETVLDPQNRDRYKPERVASVFHEVINNEESTPEIRESAERGLAQLETQLSEELEQRQNEEDGGFTNQIDQAEGMLQNLRQGLTDAQQNDADGETILKFERGIQQFEDQLTDLRKNQTEYQKNEKNTYERLRNELNVVSDTRRQSVADRAAGTEQNVQELVGQTQSQEATPEQRTQAAQQTIRLAMENPDVLSPDQVRGLSENTGVDLSDGERQFLRKLSEAQQAQNQVSSQNQVSRDIREGNLDRGFKGVSQYRSQVSGAVQSGNLERARSELDQLAKFRDHIKDKAKKGQEALSQVAPGRQKNLVFDGNWRVEDSKGRIDDALVRRNGGLTISTGSQGLLNNIQQEANMVDTVHAAMEASVALAEGANTAREQAQSQPETAPEATQEAETASEQSTEPTEQAEPVSETTQEGDAEVDALAESFAAEEQTQETEQYTPDDATSAPQNAQQRVEQRGREADRDQKLREEIPQIQEKYSALVETLKNAKKQAISAQELKSLQAEGQSLQDLRKLRNTRIDQVIKDNFNELADYLAELYVADSTNRRAIQRDDGNTGLINKAGLGGTRVVDHTERFNRSAIRRGDVLLQQRDEQSKADSETETRTEAQAIEQADLEPRSEVTTSGDHPFPHSVVPGVAYHATQEDPNTFEVQAERTRAEGGAVFFGNNTDTQIGFYLTKDKDYAEGVQPGGNVMEFYVDIQNPYYVQDNNDSSIVSRDDNGISITGITKEQRDDLIAQGYDGLLDADTEYRFHEIVVFSSDQVIRKENIQPNDEVSDGETPTDTAQEATEQQTPAAETDQQQQVEVTETQTDTEHSAGEGQTTPGEAGVWLAEAQEGFTPIEGSLTFEQLESVNKVQNYFTLRDDRALVNTPRFASEVLAQAEDNSAVLAQHLEEGQARLDRLSEKGKPQRVLAALNYHISRWNPKIESKYRRPKKDSQRFVTPLSYLLREDNTFDENTKTAISTAALAFISEQGNDLWGNVTDQEVRNVLNLSQNDEVMSHHYAQAADMGMRESTAIRDMGNRAYDALGMKPRKNTPESEIETIKLALGEMALGLLYDEGYLQQIRRDINNLQQSQDGTPVVENQVGLDARGTMAFVRSNRQYDAEVQGYQPHPTLERLKDAFMGSQDFIGDLFGGKTSRVLPTTEPVAFKQSRAKNTNRGLPKQVKEIVEAENQKPHRLNARMLSKDPENPGLLNRLSRSLLERVGGVMDPYTTNIQKNRRASVDGKNAAISRELDALFEHLDNVLDGDVSLPFFMQHEVWKMQRVGYVSHGFNPQQSKIHRFAMDMDGWNYAVDLTTGENLEQFKLAVADAFGVKTDNMTKTKALTQFDALMSDPATEQAVSVMQEMLLNPQQPVTGEQESTLAQSLTQAGDEGFHRLAGLQALAQYQIAKDSEFGGDRVFETNLVREGDGVTNGPVMTLLMTGLSGDAQADRGILEIGGLYTPDSRYSEYGEYAQDGNLDLYKRTARGVLEKIDQDMQAGRNAERYSMVWEVLGQFWDVDDADSGLSIAQRPVSSTARKTMKKPIQALAFGSGLDTVVSTVSDQFIEGIYEQMEARHGNWGQTEALIQSLNATLPQHLKIGLSQKHNYLEYTLSPKQISALKQNVENSLGETLRDTMQEQFQTLISNRNLMNKAANTTFELYDAMYQAEKEILAQDLGLPTDKNGNLLQSLSPEQVQMLDKRLEKAFPAINTPMSKGRGNGGVRNGLQMMKTERHAATREVNHSDGSTQYKSMPGFEATTAFSGNGISVPRENGSTQRRKQLEATGQQRENAAPGAGTSVLSTHSMDTATAMKTYADHNVLNVHDAAMGPAHQLPQVIQDMNRNFFETLSEFSMGEEVADALYRTLDEFNARREQYEHLDSFRNASDSSIINNAEGLAYEVLQVADGMHRNRLRALSQVESTSQYYVADGAHPITAEQRANLEQRANNESVATRVFRNRVRRQSADMAQMAANLVEQRQRARDKYQRAIDQGRSRSELDTTYAGFKQIEKIAQIYRDTGNLEQALGLTFKGEKNKATRDKWRKRLSEQLVSMHRPVQRIADAPVQLVMTVTQDLVNNDQVSGEQRDQLAQLREMLTKQMGKREQAIDARSDKVPAPDVATAVEAVTQGDVHAQARLITTLERVLNSRNMTPAGVLGTPQGPVSQTLVQSFENQPVQKAGEFIGTLRKALAEVNDNQTRNYQTVLLNELAKRVDPQMEVQYVSTASMANLEIPKKVSGAKGWYEQQGDTRRVYLKSDEFADSGMNPETALHEMVHAVLAETVAQEQTKPQARRNQNVKQLERILEAAEKKVYADPTLKGKYANAVTNVNELIAWGMTNHAFQKDVLNDMDVEGSMPDRRSSVMKAMKSFIDSLSGLLFGTNSERRANATQAIIANTAALMEQANQQRQGQMDQILSHDTGREARDAREFSTMETYEALAGETGLNPARDQRLRGLLENVVNKLHGPMGAFHGRMKELAPETPVEMMAQARINGDFIFTTRARTAGLKLSDQESFVVEQVEATLRETLDSKSTADREFMRLYSEAKKRVTPQDFHDGDWSQATRNERDNAQRTWDFIFRVDNDLGESQSDHISRFAALGLTYEPLQQALGFSLFTEATAETNQMGDRLKAAFDNVLQSTSNRINDVYSGQKVDQRMEMLAHRLVQIERKRQFTVEQERAGAVEQFENTVAQAGNKVREQIGKAADAEILKNSPYGLVRGSSTVVAKVAQDRVGELSKALEKQRNNNFKKKPLGLAMSIMNEVRGEQPETRRFYEAFSQSVRIQTERKNLAENFGNSVLDQFADGRDMSIEHSSALTQGVLRTDLSALLDKFDANQIADMVLNDVQMNEAIAGLENDLRQFTDVSGDYIIGAKALGYHQATGVATIEHMMFNAHNIAEGRGTASQGRIGRDTVDAATPMIDQLASLYALKYSDSQVRQRVQDVVRKERGRGDESGMNFLLHLHQSMKKDAQQELFDNNATHMKKGYTKEIYNPHDAMIMANMSQAQDLISKGYEFQGRLGVDNTQMDSTDRGLFILKDGGLNDYATGMLSNTGMQAMGTAVHNAGTQINQEGVPATRNKDEVNQIHARKMKAQKKPKDPMKFDPSKVNDTHLVPTLDAQGNIVDYRYVMQNQTRDNVLQRDNRLDRVMGGMKASQYDKISSREQNREVVRDLHRFYKEQYRNDPDAFVEVSLDSENQQVREAFQLLPEHTRQAVREVWGRDGMLIRNDLLDMTIGFRHYAMSDAFHKDQRNFAEEMLVTMSEKLLGDKAAIKVRRAEDKWDTMVKLVRDVWVIRNMTTFIMNQLSNMSYLAWAGVGAGKMVEDHKVAIDGIIRYQDNKNELQRLQAVEQAGVGNMDATRERIRELEHAIERNPVTELVDEGLFQTILHDIDMENDQFSYKARLNRSIDNAKAKLPDSVRKTGEFLAVSPNTPLYKALFKGTAMSDFVGRYSLFQHLQNNNPEMGRDEALSNARQAFVNYEVPSHRYLEAANKKGLVFFTRYYLRVQKMLYSLMQTQPARGMGMAVTANYFQSIPFITNSSVLMSGGSSPLGPSMLDKGALNVPGLYDEPIPLKILFSLFTD